MQAEIRDRQPIPIIQAPQSAGITKAPALSSSSGMENGIPNNPASLKERVKLCEGEFS
jgi:hypothetical protein